MAPRHEFRLGNRELIAFAGVVVLICGFTFLFGILVGREMTPAPRLAARPDRDRPAGPGAKAVPVKGEDYLTFYKTLTAPTSDVPPPGKPRIEERLVPRDEGTPALPSAPVGGAEASPPTSAPAARRSTSVGASGSAISGRPSTPRGTASGPRPVSRVAAAGPVGSPAPVMTGPASGMADPTLWTVQVSSFRSRPLAEELRARLAARGLEAYLLPSAEGGQVRYRVRVGAYPSRGEAERLAADLGSERTLTPIVIPRAR